MNVCSLEFMLAMTAIAVVLYRLPGPRWRQAVLWAGSLGFLYANMPDPWCWGVLLAFLISGFGCARLLIRRPSGAILAGYLALLVLAFVVLKRYDFLTLAIPATILQHSIVIVGLSYMFFRQIHFVVDCMQGQIDRPTLWEYLNYQLNAFTLLAGPIQRFPMFQESWRLQAPVLSDQHDLLRAYQRIFLGIVKVGMVAAAFLYVHERLLTRMDVSTTLSFSARARLLVLFVLMMYSYLFYMYFNFSGYCDIVIAGASLVGIVLPENFNWPFLARNLLDYWSRWHITLGLWIRDYLFTPLYKAGVERWPQRGSSLAVACYFVAFLMVGIWHGSSWNFCVYGLLHGLGVSTAKLWENTIVKYAGRPGLKRYRASTPIRWVAIFATFHYACFSLFFFAFDLDQGLKILRTLFLGR